MGRYNAIRVKSGNTMQPGKSSRYNIFALITEPDEYVLNLIWHLPYISKKKSYAVRLHSTTQQDMYCWQSPFTAHQSVYSWWRHQMETFSALLALCARNSPVTVEFPTQKPVTRSFDVFFDLRQNKQLSKPSWGWWFETPSCRPLWRHCNENIMGHSGINMILDI